ncbi:MAG: four helix bundle protein [Verrucomicrobiota bacterium]
MTNVQFDLNQCTKAFALRVIKLSEALPKSPAAKVLGAQVLRSGTSAGANCHEADNARSRAEFISKRAIHRNPYSPPSSKNRGMAEIL